MPRALPTASLTDIFLFDAMKTCFKCQLSKDASDFYRHKAMADGLLGKCKDCTKADVRERRFGAARQAILAYDIERSKQPGRAASSRELVQQNKERHPDRRWAQGQVHNAVRRGALIPWSVCAIPECSTTRVEAHHCDYSKPLDVVWLCCAHHRQAHALVPGHYSRKPF